MNTFMTGSCHYIESSAHNPHYGMPAAVDVKGPQLMSHYLMGILVMFPDIVFRMLDSTVVTSKAWLGSKVSLLACTPIYTYTLTPINTTPIRPYTLHPHYTYLPSPAPLIPYSHLHPCRVYLILIPISYTLHTLYLLLHTSLVFSGGADVGRGRHEAVPPQHRQVAPLPQRAALGVGERGGDGVRVQAQVRTVRRLPHDA
ncbi:hypothetical protein B484DRAFT_267203 [Ochromonadaceae sp. CCMP2298]|nr:hypothetical protein B484DRAFT_267203 [Ochromonadaceae sp. CCMP2298]